MNDISNAAREKGFSLIEVFITIALFVTIMLAVINLYTTYQTLFGVQGAKVDIIHSASLVLNDAHDAILQADHVATSHTFSGVTYTTGNADLVLELPSITSAGDIIPGSYDYVGFYASGTDAYEVTDAGSGSARASGTQRLSTVLQSIAFTYSASPVTQATSTDVDVQTSGTVKGQVVSAHLHQRTYLRN